MNRHERDGKTYGPTAEVEQITGEFPIDPDPRDEIVVDEVPGRPADALIDVKHRIRETIESAGH